MRGTRRIVHALAGCWGRTRRGRVWYVCAVEAASDLVAGFVRDHRVFRDVVQEVVVERSHIREAAVVELYAAEPMAQHR